MKKVMEVFHIPAVARLTRSLIPSLLIPAMFLVATRLPATELEYEADEGLHEEEWYDPSDWFDNDPGVDYERDWWDYGYDYGYYDDGLYDYDYDYDYGYYDNELYDDEYDYGYYNDGLYDYDYGYGYYPDDVYDDTAADNRNYGWHYEWDPEEEAWVRQYGYYQNYYENNTDAAAATATDTANRNYGWHYEWDPEEEAWVRQYGYYQNYYENTADTAAATTTTATDTANRNYGWHYEWDPEEEAWIRQYGYYDPDNLYRSPGRTTRQQQVRQQQTPQARERQQVDRQQDRWQRQPMSQMQRQQPQRQQQQARQQMSRQGSQRVVRGEIDTVRTLTLTDRSGRRQQNRVAQVLLEDGRLILVDFGRDQRNLRSSLQEGDRLVVRGQTGTIGGRRVLMANQASVNGRNIQINRSGQQGQRQQTGMRQSQPSNYISGRLLSVRPVSLGDNMNRNCIRVQLQNGQTELVDLGTRISLSELDIAPNDLITFRGQRTTINGQRVFRANTIWINGDETQLNRQSMTRNQ